MNVRSNTLLYLIPAVMSCTVFLLAQDTMFIDNEKAYLRKERAGVMFNHSLHIEKVDACGNCHHLYQEGDHIKPAENYEDFDSLHCAGCHAGKNGHNLKLGDVYHQLCVGCHKTKIREGACGAPVMCGSCHRVQKK